MNRILVVEDNEKKIEKIKDFLHNDFPEIEVEEKRSYNSALKEIVINYEKYNLILLDMSMQTYDISNEESGGEPEPLAGKNILKQMYFREIPTKVIVVTMYENYIDGTKIKQLDVELTKKFSDNYFGYIFFSHNNFDWSKKLKEEIKKII
jgi:CheY-like chemotaxis protein